MNKIITKILKEKNCNHIDCKKCPLESICPYNFDETILLMAEAYKLGYNQREKDNGKI